MATKLERTNTPGIFRRHVSDCDGGRCGCSYVVIWRHRGRQHKDTFRTYAEAREAKSAREAGDKRPTSRVRVADYFAEWIESYAGRTHRGFSETTRPEYRRPVEAHVIPAWGTWKLADVEPADVRALFGSMRKSGSTTSAIKKLRASLSAMFSTAVEDGILRSNPVQGVRIPTSVGEEHDESAKALTRAELGVFLGEVPTEWRLFFEFLAHTGVRISEATGLTWEHLDLGESPRVRVREQVYRGQRKGLKSAYARRDLPLSAGMVERLLAHRRDSYNGQDGPVFASTVGTVLIPEKVRTRVLRPAAIRASLLHPVNAWKDPDKPETWVSFHTFRHTCASLLFEAGRNVKQVQEWLGHADPGFTLRTYVHLMDAGVGDAEFLDSAVQGNTRATARPQKAANQAVAVSAESAD